MSDDVRDLKKKVELLEQRLNIPQQLSVSVKAAESAAVRQRALNLADREEVKDLTQRILTMAGRKNVLIEYTVRDLADNATLAAANCCCCCCCCSFDAAATRVGG